MNFLHILSFFFFFLSSPWPELYLNIIIELVYRSWKCSCTPVLGRNVILQQPAAHPWTDQTQAGRTCSPSTTVRIFSKAEPLPPPARREAVLSGRTCDLNIALCIVGYSSGKWVLLCLTKWEDDLLLMGPDPVSPGSFVPPTQRSSPCEPPVQSLCLGQLCSWVRGCKCECLSSEWWLRTFKGFS